MRLLAVALIVVGALFGHVAQTWASAPVSPADKPRIERLWLLEDPSREIGLAQAQASPNWQIGSSIGYAGNYTKSAFWVRLELRGQPGQPLVLALLPSFLDDVQFYIPQQAVGEQLRATKVLKPFPGGLVMSQQGDFFPPSHRAFDWRSFSADLVIPQNADRLEVLIRVATGSSSLIHPKIFTKEDFLEERKYETVYFVIQAGLTLAAIAMAFFLYLIYRESIFLLYLVYASSCLIWFFSVNGFTAQLVMAHPETISNLLGFVVCIFVPTGAIFMAQVIDVRRQAPRTYVLIVSLSALMLLAAPLALLDWYRYFAKPLVFAAVIQEMLIAVVCLRELMKGLLPSRGLAISYFVTLVSNVSLLGGFLGALTPPHVTVSLLQAIIFIDLIVLLPLAISRVENLRKKRERDERELYRVQEALQLQEEINRSHRKWVSMITHEIKTPLSVIDASRQTIDAMSVDGELRGRTAKIARATQRIDALVNSFLAEDEIAQRSQWIRPQLVSCSAFIDKVRGHLSQHHADCLAVREPLPDQQFVADTELLAVAVGNLIDNAFRHGGGDHVWIEVCCDRESSPMRIGFDVGNSGLQISREVRERLFERYYRQGENAGHGLGLWASREIARAHGGDVGYRYGEEGDNIFSLWIPAKS